MPRCLCLMILSLSVLPLTACIEEKPAPTPREWAGKWTGPEGTALTLTPQGEGNAVLVEIQSLDSLDEYDGVIDGDVIRFERNKTTETIHAGHGEETGMKWLLSYQNCLIIKTGEGFCRD